MSFYINRQFIKGFKNITENNSVVFKVTTKQFTFVFVISKTIYIIPIKHNDDYLITWVGFNSNVDGMELQIDYKTHTHDLTLNTPLCTTEILFVNNSSITMEPLTYKNDYYYDLDLYEYLNSFDQKDMKLIIKYILKYKSNIYNDIISSGNKIDDYHTIIFTDPSLNDESEEEEESEETVSEDDDFKW